MTQKQRVLQVRHRLQLNVHAIHPPANHPSTHQMHQHPGQGSGGTQLSDSVPVSMGALSLPPAGPGIPGTLQSPSTKTTCCTVTRPRWGGSQSGSCTWGSGSLSHLSSRNCAFLVLLASRESFYRAESIIALCLKPCKWHLPPIVLGTKTKFFLWLLSFVSPIQQVLSLTFWVPDTQSASSSANRTPPAPDSLPLLLSLPEGLRACWAEGTPLKEAVGSLVRWHSKAGGGWSHPGKDHECRWGCGWDLVVGREGVFPPPTLGDSLPKPG